MRATRENPCLVLKLPDEPELYYWPKLTLRVGREDITCDALLCAKRGDQNLWFLVEIDEGGVITAESRRRERRLGLPTLRFSDEHIFNNGFIQLLLGRVKDHLGEAA